MTGRPGLRSDPNIRWPTDILQIPDQLDKEPVTRTLVTGQTHTFVADVPTTPAPLGTGIAAYDGRVFAFLGTGDLYRMPPTPFGDCKRTR